MQSIAIRPATTQDIPALWEMAAALKAAKETEYFERQFAYQQKGSRVILLVSTGDKNAGYCVLNWQPKYIPFKKLGIAEIQDINVLPEFRRNGIGRALIEYCESHARDKGLEQMGIGVGLGPSFGSAQRLYIKMGYIPDGLGVVYDRKHVREGELRPVDDHLNLMFLKDLVKP